MKKIIILIVLMFFVSFIGFLYCKEGVLPVDKQNHSLKIFIIRNGESLNKITSNLFNEDLIRNKIVFYLIVKQLGIEKKIQAGDFRLSPSMDAYTIAKNLTHGTLDNWITIIEGLRKEEIAQIISKNFDIPESEIIRLSREGYLFPDTYLIPREATAETIIKILTNNFEKKVNASLKEKLAKNNLTEEDLIILASIVEKEARLAEDKQEVASILLKRLDNDWPLQVDVTIQYALGYQPDEKTWWKKYLTVDDLSIKSPYNSYKNKGLPPTAICNPGFDSIEAVVNADKTTPYWYYLSDKKGKMHYAVTIEQHNENIRKYLL